jgi:uncharacterized coiled-coil DUF342 family protein
MFLSSITFEVDPWQVALVIGGVIAVILALLGALTWTSRANSKNSQTTINFFDTMVQLNKELSAASEERLKHAVERERWENSRIDLNRRMNAQADDIEKNKRLAQTTSELHTQALDKLQKELQSAVDCQQTLEARIGELATLVQQKDEQIAGLTRRIDELEKENRDLKGERFLLITQMAEVKRERDEQKSQLDDLRSMLEALEKRETGTLHGPEAAEASDPPVVTLSTVEAAAEAADPSKGESVP